MSENILRLIPVSPQFVPSATALRRACDLLASYSPSADTVTSNITEDVQFVDQGQNWERILCPICGTELDIVWWQQAMDAAYQTGFSDLSVNLPCCGTISSLNDLQYEWPAGFARFVLEVRNLSTEVDDEKLKQLEEILGCRLRRIWARY